MAHLTRRAVLRGSAALGGARLLGAPHIAKAAATTATVWFPQGFVQDEDVSLRKAVADYEKASGNKIELSITPFAPERQKIIAALTSGVVPDVMSNNPNEILQIYAWQDRWVDVSDVVEPQKAQFSETALVSGQAYNNVTKKVGQYGVPVRAAVIPCHIWRPLVEKAGFKIEDIPKTWDAYFDFFKKVQDNLRKQGERKVYGLGFQVTANGVDPYNLFMAFLLAYGGQDIVTKDGKLHLDDPKVKQAAIKATAYLGGAYRDGYVPPSAINWNDADDNNAFHAKLMVMDVDGTLSTEVAVKEKHPEWYFKDMVTHGIGYPNDNAGKPIPSHRRCHQWDDPEGGEERPGGEGVPEVLHPAEGRRRVRRAGTGPLAAGHAVAGQEPVLAGPEGPASAGLRPAGPPRPDRAGLLRVQPGDGGSPLPARVEPGDDRRREGGGEAGGGGREGVQADRGDLREVQEGVRAEGK